MEFVDRVPQLKLCGQRKLPLLMTSDDFVFDNEMLVQAVYFGYGIGEISYPTHYFPEVSSINFCRSVKYGLGVLWTSVRFRLQKWRFGKFRIFDIHAHGLHPYCQNVDNRTSLAPKAYDTSSEAAKN